MFCVNKPPRPVGTGRRLSGGSTATERRKIGETQEEKYCNDFFTNMENLTTERDEFRHAPNNRPALTNNSQKMSQRVLRDS